MDDELRILDINTLQELAKPDSQSSIEQLAFNRDGSMLASSNSSGQIQIWKQVNGVFTLQKIFNKEGVASLAFNPSDSLLAVGALNNAYLINLSTFEEYARIPHSGTVNSVSFSSDASTLMTSSLKVLQFWDLSKIQEVKTANLVDTACSHLSQNFSEDQWKVFFENETYKPLCEQLAKTP